MLYRTLLVCLAVSTTAIAADLTGHVYDPSGGVIPGARVLLFDANGANIFTNSSADGQYHFANLNPGQYRLEVQAKGFAIFDRRNIAVTAEQPARVDAALRVGVIMESMRVESSGTPRNQMPQRIRVGGNVEPAKLLKQARPAYPENAKVRGATGIVLLRTIIHKDGTTGSIVASADADPELAAAAIQAVQKWQYQPTLLNGQPVETETTVAIQFDLK